MKIPVRVKLLIGAFIAMSMLFVIVAVVFIKKDNKELLGYQFNGRVDSVWYDANSSVRNEVTSPFVKIKGKTYYLYYHTWYFGYKIQKGDSMVKKVNTMAVILVKPNGKTYKYGVNDR
jgi:hypothetical protein